MKKILLASATLLWVLSFSACETKKADTKEDEETVVERDSVPSEYEVTEKTVETDTTTTTKKVDVDTDEDKKDKD
jgi:hypothetical protein